MSNQKRRGAGESAPSVPDFVPVKLRHRHDGLTPARQVAVVQALAESGCVREACARVGISAEAVYRLRRRPDAQSFRLAMDLALDGAVDQVEDGAFSRAIRGVEIPHYYKGELVGTHRRYDERLAMFIMRYRKPERYGRHLDRREAVRHPERAALGMADLLAWVENDARRDEAGLRRTVSTQIAAEEDESWDETHLYRWGPAADAELEERKAVDEFDDPDPPEEPIPPHMASTSSTSGLRQGFGRQAGNDVGQAKAVRHDQARSAPHCVAVSGGHGDLIISEGAEEDSPFRNRRARRAGAARERKR